jgi:hypothetical protein
MFSLRRHVLDIGKAMKKNIVTTPNATGVVSDTLSDRVHAFVSKFATLLHGGIEDCLRGHTSSTASDGLVLPHAPLVTSNPAAPKPVQRLPAKSSSSTKFSFSAVPPAPIVPLVPIVPPAPTIYAQDINWNMMSADDEATAVHGILAQFHALPDHIQTNLLGLIAQTNE